MTFRLRTIAAIVPITVLWAMPIAASLILFTAALAAPGAWTDAIDHPQLPGAALLSVWTGVASTGLALAAALVIVSGLFNSTGWRRLPSLAGAGLAMPHLAFAIGFGFLLMPSGFVARLLVGGEVPPQWVSTQDRHGFALIACLALKETPFLAALIWGQLNRGDWAGRIRAGLRAAASLGHGARSAWLRIILPQLLPRLAWPLLVVFAYAASVVDLSLVIGPTQPPTLAVVVWRDLNAAEPEIVARGAAGAALLTALIAVVASALWVAVATTASLRRRFFTAGPSAATLPRWPATGLLLMLVCVYAAVLASLAIMSISARWPYPALWPTALSLSRWTSLASALSPLLLSLSLAVASSATALCLAVIWFEAIAERHDGLAILAAGLALTLPALVTAGGLYRALLAVHLAGTLPGLFIAHLMPVLAYCLIVLKGPYRAFDPRLWAVARGLNCSRPRFWFAIKARLLNAPLWIAAAIGFSVSLVQFVPAQLIAAGRYATLPMEAVNLASGGDRPLTATYALALILPQALTFAIAALFARPRWNAA